MKKQKVIRDLLLPSAFVVLVIWFYKKEGILNILPVWIYLGVVNLGRATKKKKREGVMGLHHPALPTAPCNTRHCVLGNRAAVPA